MSNISHNTSLASASASPRPGMYGLMPAVCIHHLAEPPAVDVRLYKVQHSDKYQFRALFRKNAGVQKSQVKSTVCQVLTPLFMLGIVCIELYSNGNL